MKPFTGKVYRLGAAMPCPDYETATGRQLYTIGQMRSFAHECVKAELERCLSCYSPDDTATDWADKIRALGDEVGE